jgi:hypothetical protein
VEQAEFFGMGARLSGSSARMSATETSGPFLTPVAQGCAIAPLPSQPHVIFNSSDARAPRHQQAVAGNPCPAANAYWKRIATRSVMPMGWPEAVLWPFCVPVFS